MHISSGQLNTSNVNYFLIQTHFFMTLRMKHSVKTLSKITLEFFMAGYQFKNHFALSAVVIVKEKRIYFSNNLVKHSKFKVIPRINIYTQTNKYIFKSFVECFFWVRALLLGVAGRGGRKRN